MESCFHQETRELFIVASLAGPEITILYGGKIMKPWKNTEKRQKRVRRYYVLGKTAYQGDSFTPVSGPYPSRHEAEEKAAELQNNGVNRYGQLDYTLVFYTLVASATKMVNRFGYTVEEAELILATIEFHDSEGQM